MELIEKRKITGNLNKTIQYLENHVVGSKAMADFLKCCSKKIDKMPTFNSEKLYCVNGHWEWVYDYDIESYGYECSVCGWGHDEADASMKYCPNCGAKMEDAE